MVIGMNQEDFTLIRKSLLCMLHRVELRYNDNRQVGGVTERADKEKMREHILRLLDIVPAPHIEL